MAVRSPGEASRCTPTALAGGKFGDDWNKVEHFTQTTTVQYKAEVLGGTFGAADQLEEHHHPLQW